jgi:hypothetical protein
LLTADGQGYYRQQGGWEPNPKYLILQDCIPAQAEKAPYRKGRNYNRPPRQEIPIVVERREECDAKATICHCI